jgi:phage terminase large subunit
VGRTLRIETPRVFVPLLGPSRYKGAWGGRGSGKSHHFADALVEKNVMEPGCRAVCIREVQKSLEQSVKRLIEDKIKVHGLGNEFRVLDTHIETPGDGIIIFNGMQNHTAESIKSLEGYDVAWVEEAQSLSERSLTLLRPTLRKENSELWFSWNPRHASDPVDAMLRGVNRPPDATVVRANFTDNPWFPKVLQKEMEWDRRIDSEKYEHVWEGAYEKHSEARVFKNWRVEEFEAPADTVFRLGGDWGFSVDPTTLVRCYESRKDTGGNDWPRKRLYVDYEAYGVGIEIDDTPKLYDGLLCGCHPQVVSVCRNPRLHGWARNWPIVADSARPETISYLRRFGFGGIEAAKKGNNSVSEGVIFLQGYDIIIHPRCLHTIDEFKSYSYKRDPITDKVVPVLEDKKNHIIDPMRYALEQLRGAIRIREAVWG